MKDVSPRLLLAALVLRFLGNRCVQKLFLVLDRHAERETAGDDNQFGFRFGPPQPTSKAYWRNNANLDRFNNQRAHLNERLLS